MRPLYVLISLIFLSACGGTGKLSSVYKKMNGEWKPFYLEIAGKALPEKSYENQLLTLKDSAYTFVAESVDKGVVRINGDKMDLYGRDGVNAGKHFTCYWKVENGELNICYNLAGTDYPGSFETAGKPGYFYARFRKKE